MSYLFSTAIKLQRLERIIEDKDKHLAAKLAILELQSEITSSSVITGDDANLSYIPDDSVCRSINGQYDLILRNRNVLDIRANTILLQMVDN